MMGDGTNGGLAAAVVAAIAASSAAWAQEGERAGDYPEVAVTDYVMGCVAANGRAEEVLERCTCSIDVIGGLLPYEAYEEAETYLSLGLVAGERGALFRTSEGSQARGGGEFGRAWHEAARGHRRTRAFDDFAAVADHLVAEGLTSRAKLAIEGGSNGGLLVAAVMSRRPDLCGAVLSPVPVTDMLRYTAHHAGHAWVPEYGDPDDPEDHAALLAYSPLHNVPSMPHPPILITTAENDDRVAPWHAHKLAAALVREGASPERVHLHVERAAGHGFGRSREQAIDGGAVRLAFLARTLGMTPPAD